MNKTRTWSRLSAILLAFIMAFSLVACTDQDENELATETDADQNEDELTEETDLPEMTLSELAEYDGQDGRLAYIAVDGIVYDVTNSQRWRNGTHNGNQAGQDMSTAINSSPHGKRVLANLPRVARLDD